MAAKPAIYQANSTYLPGLSFEFADIDDIAEPPPTSTLSPLAPTSMLKTVHTERSLLPPVMSALRRHAFTSKQMGPLLNIRITGDSASRSPRTINVSQLAKKALANSNKRFPKTGEMEGIFLTTERVSGRKK